MAWAQPPGHLQSSDLDCLRSSEKRPRALDSFQNCRELAQRRLVRLQASRVSLQFKHGQSAANSGKQPLARALRSLAARLTSGGAISRDVGRDVGELTVARHLIHMRQNLTTLVASAISEEF